MHPYARGHPRGAYRGFALREVAVRDLRDRFVDHEAYPHPLVAERKDEILRYSDGLPAQLGRARSRIRRSGSNLGSERFDGEVHRADRSARDGRLLGFQ